MASSLNPNICECLMRGTEEKLEHPGQDSFINASCWCDLRPIIQTLGNLLLFDCCVVICWGHITRSHLYLTPFMPSSDLLCPPFYSSLLKQSAVLRCNLIIRYVNCPTYIAHFLFLLFSVTVRPCEMPADQPF